jgi:hypothetical protein
MNDRSVGRKATEIVDHENPVENNDGSRTCSDLLKEHARAVVRPHVPFVELRTNRPSSGNEARALQRAAPSAAARALLDLDPEYPL